ncbi:MAG: DUF6067 family protein [Candidatus Hydrogenedentes bacterium]|nr:DUF6067 family protein [Candidatus Hydrogenedentota bacterium]
MNTKSLLALLLVLTPIVYAGEEAALTVWPAPPLAKVLRDASPPDGSGQSLIIQGARNETAGAQACVRSAADMDAVSASISDLKQADSGAVIPASTATLQWERYIAIDRNSNGLPEDELVAKAPNSIPDPFWEALTIPLRANETQALWIDLAIPTEAAPGEYEGTLTITAGTQTAQLPVMLHVWDFALPEERHLSVVNWWRFPGLGFEDKIETFSDEYYEFLGKCCDFLVAHRQTDIQESLGQLVQEIDQGHGTLSYDTSRLERYAATVFEHGIRQIQLHGVGTRTGGHTDPEGRIEPVESAMNRLPALEAVIQKHGWQGRIAVNICDEPFIHHEQSYAAVVEQVHEMAPSVRIIEAVEAEYFGGLDIYVPKLSHLNLWYSRFREVQREGKELWYYTCCHPVGRYPNRFLDQSLVKARALHWINYLYDLDGYLHWGLNQFHGDDPYTQEAISHGLPLGDRAVVYPGENGFLSSLRFNTMRDGLQDFEYLWVLEDKLRQIKERVGTDAFWLDPRQRPLELCGRVVQSFYEHTRDAAVLMETRRMIAEEIVALDREPLLVVQTSPPENTFVPAGPRNVGVRGLIAPGAAVTVNGRAVPVRESGYFCLPYFMPDDKPVITVTVEQAGKERSATRSFILQEQ